MPFQIIGIWLRSLLSLLILSGGLFLLCDWHNRSQVRVAEAPTTVVADPAAQSDGRAFHSEFAFDPQWNATNACLAVGASLLIWTFFGRLIFLASVALSQAAGGSKGKDEPNEKLPTDLLDEDPKADRVGEAQRLQRPDGSEIRIERYGAPDAPLIVWTHGWGADSTEWFYQKKHLAKHFCLLTWDEPGLGLSRKPANNDYSLENFAANLKAVLETTKDRQVILAGHSIGGMTILSFCKLYPDLLRARVAGLILVHTTYTNPVRTSKNPRLNTALEKPVLVPLMHLTIAAWPLVWVANWLSYLNGSASRSTHKSSFAGTETLGQLNFIAKYNAKARPDVLARGMLGMLKYDATATLPKIDVPTLVIIGDKDTTTIPEAGKYIASQIPNSRLATLAPARHMGLIEHHGVFNKLVHDFSKSCLKP